jgi:hypothetical protein
LVFFGTTDTEMFSWPDRGKPEFERALVDIHAANFGSQGTAPRSLLWRMQNGELDGYDAKLIVFQLWGIGDLLNPEDTQSLTNLAPILAEIKARQPRARILLSAPFPRGFNSRDEWARISAERASGHPLSTTGQSSTPTSANASTRATVRMTLRCGLAGASRE